MSQTVKLSSLGVVHMTGIESFQSENETVCGKTLERGGVLTDDGVTCLACLKKLREIPKSIAKQNGIIEYSRY